MKITIELNEAVVRRVDTIIASGDNVLSKLTREEVIAALATRGIAELSVASGLMPPLAEMTDEHRAIYEEAARALK